MCWSNFLLLPIPTALVTGRHSRRSLYRIFFGREGHKISYRDKLDTIDSWMTKIHSGAVVTPYRTVPRWSSFTGACARVPVWCTPSPTPPNENEVCGLCYVFRVPPLC